MKKVIPLSHKQDAEDREAMDKLHRAYSLIRDGISEAAGVIGDEEAAEMTLKIAASYWTFRGLDEDLAAIFEEILTEDD
jgi:hypothetical protein